MKTVFYARVSTSEQDLSHQEAQARAAGFTLDVIVADHGVSGVSVPLRERPEGRRLFDMLREGDTLVVRWIDRLGRNYQDVTQTIRDLLARGVTIKTVINGMEFNGQAKDAMTKAVRDALLGFMAAMAEAQAETNKEAQAAGITAAKARDAECARLGQPARAYKGRKPSFDRGQMDLVLDLLAKGEAPARIAREAGVSRQVVYRIKEDPSGAEEALRVWEG